MTEFNLSEVLQNDILILCALSNDKTENKTELFIEATEKLENHIKEFIRLLKEEFCNSNNIEFSGKLIFKTIDKLARDKLI